MKLGENIQRQFFLPSFINLGQLVTKYWSVALLVFFLANINETYSFWIQLLRILLTTEQDFVFRNNFGCISILAKVLCACSPPLLPYPSFFGTWSLLFRLKNIWDLCIFSHFRIWRLDSMFVRENGGNSQNWIMRCAYFVRNILVKKQKKCLQQHWYQYHLHFDAFYIYIFLSTKSIFV